MVELQGNIIRRPDGRFIYCRGPGRNRTNWEKLVAFRASEDAVRVLERYKSDFHGWTYTETLEVALKLMDVFQPLSGYVSVEAFGDEPEGWLKKARELLK